MVLELINVVMNNCNYLQTVEESPLIHGASRRGGGDVDANNYDNGSDEDGESIDYVAVDNS